jgi:hypothetical protein
MRDHFLPLLLHLDHLPSIKNTTRRGGSGRFSVPQRKNLSQVELSKDKQKVTFKPALSLTRVTHTSALKAQQKKKGPHVQA